MGDMSKYEAMRENGVSPEEIYLAIDADYSGHLMTTWKIARQVLDLSFIEVKELYVKATTDYESLNEYQAQIILPMIETASRLADLPLEDWNALRYPQIPEIMARTSDGDKAAIDELSDLIVHWPTVDWHWGRPTDFLKYISGNVIEVAALVLPALIDLLPQSDEELAWHLREIILDIATYTDPRLVKDYVPTSKREAYIMRVTPIAECLIGGVSIIQERLKIDSPYAVKAAQELQEQFSTGRLKDPLIAFLFWDALGDEERQ